MTVIVIRETAWDDPAAVSLREAQRIEIAERYGTDDSEPGPAPSADDIAVFLVASVDGEPVGCGGLREIGVDHGEVKRMFVARGSRGSGVATAVLRALETSGAARGWTRLVLETGDAQPDAIRFYEREGFESIPCFGHYVGEPLSRCFGKSLIAD